MSIKYSYWFMCDGHTFIKPQKKSLKKVAKEMVTIAKNNPYGMVCPVTVLKDGEEIGRIGKPVHVDKDGNVNIQEWIDSIVGEHNLNIHHTEVIKIKL